MTFDPSSMDIDRCNSIFELFATFNFAYAILSKSNGVYKSKKVELSSEQILAENQRDDDFDDKSFVSMVDYHLIKPFTTLYISVRKYRLDISLLSNSILSRRQIAEKNNDERAKAKCEILSQKILGFEFIIHQCLNDTIKSKKSAKYNIDQRFPLVSYLLGLYCISILMLGASEGPHKHSSILVLDAAAIITLLVMRHAMNRHKKYNYFDVTLNFLIGILITVAFHLGFGIYGPTHLSETYQKMTSIEKEGYFVRLVVAGNMLFPLSHFVYFFLKFSIKTLIAEIEVRNRLKPIRTGLSDISDGLDDISI